MGPGQIGAPPGWTELTLVEVKQYGVERMLAELAAILASAGTVSRQPGA